MSSQFIKQLAALSLCGIFSFMFESASLICRGQSGDQPPELVNARHLETKPIEAISLDSARTNEQSPRSGDRGYELPRNVARERLRREGEYWQLTGQSREWPLLAYCWEASAVAYSPLYFEDETLERCGHHYGRLQPVLSAAHFFGRIPVIPYMYGASFSQPCHYSLGYCRPGDCVPHYLTTPRLSLRGAVYQAAAVAGAVTAVP